MRRSSLLSIISASAALANQLDLLPAQQPVDSAALLDGDTSLVDASSLQIASDNMLNVKSSIDKNEAVRPGVVENNKQLQDAFSPPLDLSLTTGFTSEQNGERTVHRSDVHEQEQSIGPEDHVVNALPREQSEVIPQPHPSRHAHHRHTHSHYSTRHKRRHHRNTSKPRSTVATSDTSDERQIQQSVGRSPQTESARRDPSDDLLDTTISASAAATEKQNKVNFRTIRNLEDVKTEEDLIAFNLASQGDLEASSVGGSFHDSTRDGGSSNTRYHLDNSVVNSLSGDTGGLHTSGAANLHPLGSRSVTAVVGACIAFMVAFEAVL